MFSVSIYLIYLNFKISKKLLLRKCKNQTDLLLLVGKRRPSDIVPLKIGDKKGFTHRCEEHHQPKRKAPDENQD